MKNNIYENAINEAGFQLEVAEERFEWLGTIFVAAKDASDQYMKDNLITIAD